MASRKVIVFGPTGAVGSATAHTAAELGAKVTLAMRDTKKAIPGLDADAEARAGFERITADLTQPSTVQDAVSTSGAKAAFIYSAHASSDHMKATIEALKAGGIEFVVFLSSYTVRGDLAAFTPDQAIPYVHAQVELNLQKVFGADGFVSARPGSFASNNLRHKAGIQKGELHIYRPDTTVDNIAPEDIGRVCGTVLAKGPQGSERAIYLYGPEFRSVKDSLQYIAKQLGKELEFKPTTKQESHDQFTKLGFPKVIADYMIEQQDAPKAAPGELRIYRYVVDNEHLSNVEKYTGKRSTTFEEWVEQNKQKFAS